MALRPHALRWPVHSTKSCSNVLSTLPGATEHWKCKQCEMRRAQGIKSTIDFEKNVKYLINNVFNIGHFEVMLLGYLKYIIKFKKKDCLSCGMPKWN